MGEVRVKVKVRAKAKVRVKVRFSVRVTGGAKQHVSDVTPTLVVLGPWLGLGVASGVVLRSWP